MQRPLEALLRLQSRHPLAVVAVVFLLALISLPRAVKLLSSVATDLVHLLPRSTPSVVASDAIGEKLGGRQSLYLVVHSPSPEANESAVKALKPFLEGHELVGEVEIEKKGYDFLDRHKLLLLDLQDIYKLRDRLKEKIEREKLGGLFIDLEAGEGGGGEAKDEFKEMARRYKDRFTQGVQSRYHRSDDGTVYVVDIRPKLADSGLGFFRRFGRAIEGHVGNFDFSRYGQNFELGWAGAIRTRVEQYDAIIEDLVKAGIVSLAAILAVLYAYFAYLIGRARRARKAPTSRARRLIIPLVPVALVFIPMGLSTLIGFGFSSLFFERLNLVTSFLFSIIFGLGVDVGIHLVTRFLQDRSAGCSMGLAHRNIVLKTGKSCATSVLTTVASFYVLTVTDFRGFSEFGWIAGNGLVIALVCYLVVEPCLILLADRWGLFGRGIFAEEDAPRAVAARTLRFATPALAVVLATVAAAVLYAEGVSFEWNLARLKMRFSGTETQRERVKTVFNRVNRPAAYLIETEVESRRLSDILRRRKEADKHSPTIQYFRGYYDLVPFDQEEKLALLAEVRGMLADDALNAVTGDEKELLDELRDTIAKTEPVTRDSVPPEAVRMFLGEGGDASSSVAYVLPEGSLELDDGNNARAFANDVGEIEAFGHRYPAASDALVFAEVLETLFRDSKIAILLSGAVLFVLVTLHFRDPRKVAFVMAGLGGGIAWMLALMRMSGLKLNFYNMIVIPATIGMGEDNSVHMLDRHEELGRSSVAEAWRTSGGAAFMASLTTMLGYLGLCFARHPGLSSIGWMAILGMGTCLVGSLVLLPLLMAVGLKSDITGTSRPSPRRARQSGV